MTIKLEKLNNKTHQKIKVMPDGVHQHNANLHMCHLSLEEINLAAQYYPILFAKDTDTGQFQPIALFGLNVDENIYQQMNIWQKCYLPLKLASQPFFLTKTANDTPELAINMNDPRVQANKGQALFNGLEASQYLNQQAQCLSDLSKGFILNEIFVKELLAVELIEPLALDITYNDGKQHKLTGLYTINRENLEKVAPSTQQQFADKGYVELIHNMLGSLTHINTLIELSNQHSVANTAVTE